MRGGPPSHVDLASLGTAPLQQNFDPLGLPADGWRPGSILGASRQIIHVLLEGGRTRCGRLRSQNFSLALRVECLC